MEGVERFAALPADQPIKSFCLSQYAMLKAFLATGKDTLLALEDDVLFQDLGHLPAALNELPVAWDILYLGANITDGVTGAKEYPPRRISNYLHQVYRAWTTHAVAYSRNCAMRIVQLYNPADMYDAWLSEAFLGACNAYIVNPMICWQRPGKSDLWGQETDYIGSFVEGNKIMNFKISQS